jgi:hypothetical protein
MEGSGTRKPQKNRDPIDPDPQHCSAHQRFGYSSVFVLGFNCVRGSHKLNMEYPKFTRAPCSFADPGCLSRIPDPNFSSRIPDPNFSSRIRIFHPGSEFFIPIPRSASKNLSIFTQKNWFLSSRKYDPGFHSGSGSQ